ncbi:MAG: ketoacyl-ACP synthase III [Deltaproteobacteria bacterium]|jgi:3-oxoacyl-[acyl-carrier-protein] synthase-3|nr:ketoacyl-ACP synthase III [Deltaproteobacteria bacterium]MBW2496575.1 ketoacyl-ACP synthase III [Deltaproteobacteria bacterium]
MGLQILGWGSALPGKIVTNADLEKTLDTSDEWIVERTGIRERRIGTHTADLAIEAGRVALAHAAIDPATIDLAILCTTTPDETVPATSARVHQELGLGGGAFDLNAACSGFVYGLVAASGMLSTGARRVLLVGAETLSRITDWQDRSTAVLFGDGGGALVLERSEDPGQLLSWDLGLDGTAREILKAEVGGWIEMDGREVFKRAVRAVVESASRTLEAAGCGPEDVALLVPHQANIRIIQAACERLGIELDRTALVIGHTGNTSSASIPLAWIEAIEKGRLKQGDRVLLTGFGAGMTWASALIEWRSPANEGKVSRA